MLHRLRALAARVIPRPAVGYRCDTDGCTTPELIVRQLLLRRADQAAAAAGWTYDRATTDTRCPVHAVRP